MICRQNVKKYTIATLLSSCAVTAFAQTAPRSDDILYDIQRQQQQFQSHLPPILQEENQSSNQQDIPELSEEQLLANPEFLQQLLDNAIDNQQIEGIRVLLPIYLKSSNYDPILYQYGQAIVAELENDVTKAIDLYRKIIAEQPTLNPVRLKLVHALIWDKQFTSAEHQLDKLRSENNLPEEIQQHIEQQQYWLKQQHRWSVNGKIRYLNDKNVNQAPRKSEYGAWKLPEAQSAQGIAYHIGVSKKYATTDHIAVGLQAYIDGKQYHKHHQYDDITAHVSTGVHHQTAKYEWSLSPFFEQRWFSQEPYSHHAGVKSQYNHLFSARWQAFTQVQYGQKTHKKRHHLNAKIGQISASIRHVRKPTQIWFWGIDGTYEHSQDVSERHRRYGAWFGWEQDWHYGLSTSLVAGVSKVNYKVQDIFQIKRRDTDYFLQGSIWHRALHWKGLTPRLTAVWRNQQSNHFLYGYDKSQVFMELSKTF